MGKEKYSGINIQWPISQDIISGNKSVETRTYPLPSKYLNKEILLIETPGRRGSFKARAIAIIRFTHSFKYKSKSEFKKDYKRHLVSSDSEWAWSDKPKWGWEVTLVRTLEQPITNLPHGIVFRGNISLKR